MFTPNPPNPFHATTVVREVPPVPARLVVREDHSRSVLVRNRSPDVPFTWSVNPYRGCTHACAYCYARRTHEHLDHGAGLDFERLVYVKRTAPELLQAAFGRRSWRGEPLNCSGVTDPYQPLERRERVMRRLLEVVVAHRNPISIVTRSPLILRDLDLLTQLAVHDAVRVQLSVPLLDANVARALEPGTAPPAARLDTIRRLVEAGIPTGISVAPVIPGLNDHTLARTLEVGAQAGATWAWMSLLRLPGSVEHVFVERLQAALPHRAEAVLDRLRRARGGTLSCSAFGDRHRGVDASWQLTRQTFWRWCTKLGLGDAARRFPATTPFRRPGQAEQLALFG